MIDNRKLTILYGSQTGCAQDLAEQIFRESKKYLFNGPVTSMDEYNVEHLIDEKLVIFVCSTTGQGTEPDNMKLFWKFLLRKSLPSTSLTGMHYAVLGMGDSSYKKFNFVAKRLSKRLQQLGGKEILPIGLCDDQHDLGAFGTISKWLPDFWTKLCQIYPLPNGVVMDECLKQCKWKVSKSSHKDKAMDEFADMYDGCKDAIFDKPFIGTLLTNVRTTAVTHFQDVRLISFQVPDNVQWSPGDVVMIRPKNSQKTVDNLFKTFQDAELKMYPETIIELEAIYSDMPLPSHLKKPMSLRTIATQLWDITAIPRPRTFELLAINCTNELEKEKLLEFTTAEGQQDLYSYANRPRRTVLEVLRDFPNATAALTVDIIFELFQPIRPRSFSIASCMESTKLEILVAIVEYKTILSTPRLGLCSNWLKNLQPQDAVSAVIKKGTFVLPSIIDNQPIIMVGPGTGLAPFRSILQARQHEKLKNQESSASSCVLFFGARGQKADFHCKADLGEMVENGVLRLFTAFSRDQDDKIYVQHRIIEQHKLLKELLINQNGWFYVAGNSKNMPQAVRESLEKSLDNEEFVEKMIKTGRYQEETWA